MLILIVTHDSIYIWTYSRLRFCACTETSRHLNIGVINRWPWFYPTPFTYIHSGIDVVGQGTAFAEFVGVAEICVTFSSAPNSTVTVTVQTGRDSDTAQGKSIRCSATIISNSRWTPLRKGNDDSNPVVQLYIDDWVQVLLTLWEHNEYTQCKNIL